MLCSYSGARIVTRPLGFSIILTRIITVLTTAHAPGTIIISKAPAAASHNIILLHTLGGYLNQQLEYSMLAPVSLSYSNPLNQFLRP